MRWEELDSMKSKLFQQLGEDGYNSELSKEMKRIQEILEKEKETKVKVALFGQPGAGKSSLINSFVGEKLAEVGVETDKTKGPAEYEYNNLIFVDLPGFGTKMFPKETYFDKIPIDDYDLFLAVFSGKFHEADNEFFQELKKRGKVTIFVYNKVDNLWEEGSTLDELKKRVEADLRKQIKDESSPLVFTSCRTKEGLGELEKIIYNKLDDAKKERWIRNAKAYTEEIIEEKKKILTAELLTLVAFFSSINFWTGWLFTFFQVFLPESLGEIICNKISEYFGLEQIDPSLLKHGLAVSKKDCFKKFNCLESFIVRCIEETAELAKKALVENIKFE